MAKSIWSELYSICSSIFGTVATAERELLERIIQLLRHELAADRASIFLVEEESLRARIATGTEDLEIDIRKGVAGHVHRSGEPYLCNDPVSDPYFFSKIDEATGYKTRTLLAVPLKGPSGRRLGVIEALNSSRGKFDENDLEVAQTLAFLAGTAIEQRRQVSQLESDNDRRARAQQSFWRRFEGMKLESTHAGLREIYRRIPKLAAHDTAILIEGETGTGKEVVAHLLHRASPRSEGPFVAINCTAIPETLFEAELFGVAKGAATGTGERAGHLELANGGTLFLDEVGDLPKPLQAKLLRVLQEKKIVRVGEPHKQRPVDFRLICATNRGLARQVEEGGFRDDLYYRINVVRIELPPLRARTADIVPLCGSFVEEFARGRGFTRKAFSEDAIRALHAYSWPGNIRQLRNVVEHALILSESASQVEAQHLGLPSAGRAAASVDAGAAPLTSSANLNLRQALGAFQRAHIVRALETTAGNRTRAAGLLGLTREGLRQAMKRQGIK